MTTAAQRFFARSVLRLLQLLSLLAVWIGLSNVNAFMRALEAWGQGAISLPALCWKILPVTGCLIPAVVCLVGAQLALRHVKIPTHHPNEPWMANPMWAERHIRLGNRGVFWGMCACLLSYFGIAVPLAIGTEKTAIMVVMGAVGLMLLGIANMFWRNRKWNTAELRLAANPGVVGGPFCGVAILKESFPAGTVFEISLQCKQTTSGSVSRRGGSQSSKTETVWSSTLFIDKPLPSEAPDRTLIPCSFAIPFECTPTSEGNASARCTTSWLLSVNQKARVGSGGAIFEVPVYRTQESRSDFTLDKNPLAPFEQQVDLEAVLKRVQMTRTPLPGGGVQLTFGIWDGEAAYSLALLALVCGAGILACVWFITSAYGIAFAALLPAIILASCLYSLLDMSLWRSSLKIEANELRGESGWRGFRETLVASMSDEPRFSSEFEFRRENREWRRVVLHLPATQREGIVSSAASMTLVRRLESEAEAAAVVQWLRREVGLSDISSI
jgi:hypothetical protein